VTRRQLIVLLVLASLWGASFMFIKVAVRELAPAATSSPRSPSPSRHSATRLRRSTAFVRSPTRRRS
jgi:hypothetical protein